MASFLRPLEGDFAVQKSQIPFKALLTDQALEQEIKNLKWHEGITGATHNEALLDRVVAVALDSGQSIGTRVTYILPQGICF